MTLPATPTRRRPIYSAALRAECRRMADAGWSAYRIHRLLQQRHLNPCPAVTTIVFWIDEERYQAAMKARLAKSAADHVASARFTLNGKSPGYRKAFIRRLHDEDIPVKHIAKVCTIVFGSPWSALAVRRVLAEATR